MRINVEHRPGAALALVALSPGESIRAEADAMVSMAGDIAVKTEGTRKTGGLLAGLGRKFLGGESFFTNLFTANGPAELALAPSLPGDIAVHDLVAEQPLFIQGSSYVAAPDSIAIDTKFQGLVRGLVSGESMFFLRASGTGSVIINAFGGIEARDLDGELWVDTGHLVAFTAGIEYQVSKASRGWLGAWFSGEGFILKLKGQGRVYLQTRNPHAFGRTIGRLLPAK